MENNSNGSSISSEETAHNSSIKQLYENLTPATEEELAEIWSKWPDLCIALFRERASAEFLCGYKHADDYLTVALERCQSTKQRLEMYHQLICHNSAKGKYGVAINYGRKALEVLTFAFPSMSAKELKAQTLGFQSHSTYTTASSTWYASAAKQSVVLSPALSLLASSEKMSKLPESTCLNENFLFRQYELFTDLFKQKEGIQYLNTVELNHDEAREAEALCLNSLIIPAFFINQPLFRLICFLSGIHLFQNKLSCTHILPLAMLGSILAVDFHDFELAYEIGNAALSLCDRFPTFSSGSGKSNVLAVVGGSIAPYKVSFEKSISMFSEARTLATQSGDFSNAGYTLMQRLMFAFYNGSRLDSVAEEIVNDRLLNQRHVHDRIAGDLLSGLDLIVSKLSSRHLSNLDLLTESPAELDYIQKWIASPAPSPLV
jgi:hypothetical protein